MKQHELDKLHDLILYYVNTNRVLDRYAISNYVNELIDAARIPQPSPAIESDDPAKPTS